LQDGKSMFLVVLGLRKKSNALSRRPVKEIGC